MIPLVLGILFTLALVAIGAGLFTIWVDHVEQQVAAAEIQRSRRLAAAHRLPKPMTERASQGFNRRVNPSSPRPRP